MTTLIKVINDKLNCRIVHFLNVDGVIYALKHRYDNTIPNNFRPYISFYEYFGFYESDYKTVLPLYRISHRIDTELHWSPADKKYEWSDIAYDVTCQLLISKNKIIKAYEDKTEAIDKIINENN